MGPSMTFTISYLPTVGDLSIFLSRFIGSFFVLKRQIYPKNEMEIVYKYDLQSARRKASNLRQVVISNAINAQKDGNYFSK